MAERAQNDVRTAENRGHGMREHYERSTEQRERELMSDVRYYMSGITNLGDLHTLRNMARKLFELEKRRRAMDCMGQRLAR